MITIEFVLFDCMETIVDMTQLPIRRDYAFWAYSGSGAEYLWNDFEEFFDEYRLAAESIDSKSPQYKEHSMTLRFKLMLDRRNTKEDRKKLLERIHQNYWKNYSGRCYVEDETAEILKYLSNRYKLGVVSNFMVEDGIEDLLNKTGITDYFQFVVTSVKNGWRKPHRNIYDEAVKKAGVGPQDICFVGDDYICDYEGPVKMGIRAFLYDRKVKYPGLSDRITHLTELKQFL
ncbi:MAG TPA: HAD family hydrolase [Pseudobacteroides sp.]|uniref:HAD family hydrolase n=1 Tax=Pseudobacteroides sp. TaxID=1968840 RepID=UPI002F934DFB